MKKNYDIVLILFIAFALFRLSNYFIIKKQENNLDLLTNESEGKIISYKYDSKSKGPCYHNITIEYELDDKKYEYSYNYKGPAEKISSEGNYIKILYNPNEKEKVVPKIILEYNKERLEFEKKTCIVFISIDIALCAYSYKKKIDV